MNLLGARVKDLIKLNFSDWSYKNQAKQLKDDLSNSDLVLEQILSKISSDLTTEI